MKTPLVSLTLTLAVAAPTAAAFQEPLFHPPHISSAGPNPLALDSEDMDGDGLLDLVLAERGTPEVCVYFGDGTGGLSLPICYVGAQDTRDLRLGDLDGDGDIDVATVGAAAGALFLFLNDGMGNLSTTRSLLIPTGVQHMDMADLDHDGDLDICFTLFWTSQVDVMLNDGSANFTLSSSHPLPLRGADLELVDLDEDGVLDMAVTGNSLGVGNAVYVFLGDGSGGFGPRADYDTGSDCTADLVAADFDGDGHADVAVGTCAGLSVLSGNGAGAFGPPTFLTSPTWPANWAAVPGVGDFDGDGRADLAGLVTDPAPVNGVITVFSYDPPLGWEIDGDFDIGGSGGWGAVHALDLDDDGFPDLAVAYADHLALFAHTAVDCNQNGLFDPEEIEDGVAQDLNHNGVPDECEPIGTNYCVATPNSSGLPASIAGLGSEAIADNDVMLVTTDVGCNQFGYYLMSDTPGFLPGFGGSHGNLCLGPPIVRFAKHVGFSGPDCIITLKLDLTDLPQGVVFQPGETWNFQLWFRDVNPNFTSNTSDGLAITFR